MTPSGLPGALTDDQLQMYRSLQKKAEPNDPPAYTYPPAPPAPELPTELELAEQRQALSAEWATGSRKMVEAFNRTRSLFAKLDAAGGGQRAAELRPELTEQLQAFAVRLAAELEQTKQQRRR